MNQTGLPICRLEGIMCLVHKTTSFIIYLYKWMTRPDIEYYVWFWALQGCSGAKKRLKKKAIKMNQGLEQLPYEAARMFGAFCLMD